MEQTLRGVFAAVLTPYTADLAVDFDLLGRHCRRLLDEGLHGVSLFGTTGEGPALDAAERRTGLEAVLAAGVPASKILPATGAASLMETVALSRHALGLGCTNLLVMPPFFFKGIDDEGAYTYFAEVVTRTGSDAARYYLYNFPAITDVWINRPVVARLRQRFGAAIAGVKDSSGDWDYVTGLIADNPGLAVFSGWESLIPKLVRAGGSGNISGLANIIGPHLRHNFDAAATADQEPAFAVLRTFVDDVCRHPVTAAIKALNADLRGESSWRNIRPPLAPLNPAARLAIPDALKR